MKTFLQRSVFAIIVPTLAFATCAQVVKQVPPEGGPPKPFNVPPHRDFTLPNGMKVTLVPYGNVPKVTVDVIVRSGNLNEGENQVWLANITGDLMKEGTETRSAGQVAKEAAAVGGAITVNVAPTRRRSRAMPSLNSAPRCWRCWPR